MLFGKLFTNPKMWVNGNADEITMGGVYTCKDVQNVPTGDGALLVFKTENTVKQVFIPVGEEGVVYTRVLGEEWTSVTGTSEETEALIQSAIVKANQAQAKADVIDTRLNNIIVESGTSDAEVVAARTDSSGQTFPTLGQRLDTQFGEIKEDLSHIEAGQIVGMTPTGKTVESSNLFSTASLVASSKYVDRIVNGKAFLVDSTNLDTYIIPVDGESTYTFTNCRTALLVSDLEYTAVGSVLTYSTEIDSTGGAYILFSFNRTTYPPTSYKITKPVAEYVIPNNWNLNNGTKTGYQRKTGTIASGGSLALTGKTAIKYGYQIIFKAFISAFNEIKLAFYNYNNSAITNAINVTASDLVIYVGNNAVETLPHGLTITNDISLVLDYRSDGVKITLYSDGSSFTTTTTFGRLITGVVSTSIISTGTICTGATLEMAVPRAKKPIWYFGDSYISLTNTARWAYYLLYDGFDGNTLLNGYAGGTSASTVMALTALLRYGTPKYAVFATGMNDGSDSADAPSISWSTARDSFISLCESNNIEMIFATVPTVPSVNNEQKNGWIKSSGYKYIDFAKAVGADSTGTWYSGMLSTDNVHPTEKGAKALYTQAITDLPELLV